MRHVWLLERTHGRGRHGNEPTASQYRTGAASWTGSCGRKSRRGTAFRGYQRRCSGHDCGTSAATGGSGAQVFQTYCVTCHGAEGKGDGPAAAGLDPKPASFSANAFRLDPNGNGKKGEVDDIKAVVRDGAAKYGGSPMMAPWAMLSAEQLQAVTEYVKSLSGS